MLAATLLSIHNLHTLLNLCTQIRESIVAGCFSQFAEDYLARGAFLENDPESNLTL
jgi:tRNA-guanine family transglycosylase